MGEYMANVTRRWLEATERHRKEREARIETSIPRQLSWKQARNTRKEPVTGGD